MSHHSFDTNVAKKIGILPAIIYESIKFWCEKNKANDRHFYDGEYWTYNSLKAWSEIFEYASVDQIKRALKKLEDEKFIITGNYNNSAYDRTKWYAIPENMDLAKMPNGLGNNASPIPVNKPGINNIVEIKTIVDYLNSRAGKNYRASSEKTKRLIRARFMESFTVEDFKKVIDVKCDEWLGTDMSRYLRPETLFGTKFESYLNETKAPSNWYDSPEYQ